MAEMASGHVPVLFRPIPVYGKSVVTTTPKGNETNQLFQPWKEDKNTRPEVCKGREQMVYPDLIRRQEGYFGNFYYPHMFLKGMCEENSKINEILETSQGDYHQRSTPMYPGVSPVVPPIVYTLQKENQYVAGRKVFPCPQCRYTTDRRNNLKRHMLTMHQTCSKMLECCGILFNTKASLREHSMIFHYHGYTCLYCGRRFCRKALLKRHLSVHNGQKDFTCHICDYATSHKSNLERHRKVHFRQNIDLIEDAGIQNNGKNFVDSGSDVDISISTDDEIDVSSD